MNDSNQSSGNRGATGQNHLTAEKLRSRRAFLKKAVKRSMAPAIIVYSAHKMAPPAFGRTVI